MKAFDVNNPYFRTKVLTASPGELRLMLLEGAVRYIGLGREGLASKDYEKVYEGFSQARSIVMELMNVNRQLGYKTLVAWGILLGLALGFGTDFVLEIAGA